VVGGRSRFEAVNERDGRWARNMAGLSKEIVISESRDKPRTARTARTVIGGGRKQCHGLDEALIGLVVHHPGPPHRVSGDDAPNTESWLSDVQRRNTRRYDSGKSARPGPRASFTSVYTSSTAPTRTPAGVKQSVREFMLSAGATDLCPS
jgi:hypothetical protein